MDIVCIQPISISSAAQVEAYNITEHVIFSQI